VNLPATLHLPLTPGRLGRRSRSRRKRRRVLGIKKAARIERPFLWSDGVVE